MTEHEVLLDSYWLDHGNEWFDTLQPNKPIVIGEGVLNYLNQYPTVYRVSLHHDPKLLGKMYLTVRDHFTGGLRILNSTPLTLGLFVDYRIWLAEQFVTYVHGKELEEADLHQQVYELLIQHTTDFESPYLWYIEALIKEG